RSRVSDLSQIYVRSATQLFSVGADSIKKKTLPPPIPLSALVTLREVKDPQTITHFDLYRSIEIGGNTAPGYGTGHSIDAMQNLAAALPPGYGYEWSGIAREQVEGGSQAFMIFALGIAFVFLVLAAQY